MKNDFLLIREKKTFDFKGQYCRYDDETYLLTKSKHKMITTSDTIPICFKVEYNYDSIISGLCFDYIQKKCSKKLFKKISS